MPLMQTMVRAHAVSSDLSVSPKSGSPRSCASPASSFRVDPMSRWKKGLRLQLKWVVVVAMCVFTVGPTISVWMVSWQSASDGVSSINSQGRTSVEGVTVKLRSSMMLATKSAFMDLIQPTEAMALTQSFRLKGTGMLGLAGPTASLNYSVALGALGLPFDLRGNPFLSVITYELRFRPILSFAGGAPVVSRTTAFARMNLDALRGTNDPTIYMASVTPNEFYNASETVYFYVDQETGQPVSALFRQTGPLVVSSADLASPESFVWKNELDFDENTGLTEILLGYQVPTTDSLAALYIGLYTNVFTVSSFLKSFLNGPKQRLFVFFRTPAGTLIGASHGKYFSHSDIDYSANNPLTNPPPVAEFRRYTPVNSTDPIIQSAGIWLQAAFLSWDAIPDQSISQSLNGEDYWLSTAAISTEMGLRVNLVLLVDRESTMGPIEANTVATLDAIQRTNTRMMITLIVVVLLALLCALLISYLLTISLSRLAFGMDMLSLLRFDEEEPDQSLLVGRSRFTEVSKCEHSFVSLERGLKAFVKYVPRDVVRMMLAGEMESTNVMARRVVSILFMDIEGFSTLCERILVDQLNRLTQDYLQAMCEIIVASKGTLDKFIGDCIMALWNAPRHLKHHEKAAVGAALDMQARLLQLHKEWIAEGIPAVKFRVGINTDAVLVGNFGCEYRINYTVLGDGVNLASRLEAANKPFGTAALVADSTRSKAGSDYAFRRIGKITVPGKAEVLTVFEPLYRIPGDDTVMCTANILCSQDAMAVSLESSSASELSSEGGILNAWRAVPKPALDGLAQKYEEGLDHFIAGDLQLAEMAFMEASVLAPEDGPTKLLLELCHEGKKPGVRWDGVIRFEHK